MKFAEVERAAYLLSQQPEGKIFFAWLEKNYALTPVGKMSKLGSVDPLAMAMRAGAQGMALDIRSMIERGRKPTRVDSKLPRRYTATPDPA